jgi:DNA-binding FadR family transcriptional regulator
MVGTMISRRPGSSMYEQVASAIREKIISGELAPGAQLPSEKYLAEEYGVGRDTVRDAMQHLRKEGLIDSRRGYRSTVRRLDQREIVNLHKGARVVARMPTPDEVEELEIVGEGVPVLVVDGTRVYRSDRYELVVPE